VRRVGGIRGRRWVMISLWWVLYGVFLLFWGCFCRGAVWNFGYQPFILIGIKGGEGSLEVGPGGGWGLVYIVSWGLFLGSWGEGVMHAVLGNLDTG
jgi:hypothetical protein